jgi:uncharacterized protein (DUF427 family)
VVDAKVKYTPLSSIKASVLDSLTRSQKCDGYKPTVFMASYYMSEAAAAMVKDYYWWKIYTSAVKELEF